MYFLGEFYALLQGDSRRSHSDAMAIEGIAPLPGRLVSGRDDHVPPASLRPVERRVGARDRLFERLVGADLGESDAHGT